MKNCKIILEDGKEFLVPKGTALSEIENLYYSKHKSKIMAFKVNHNLQELTYKIQDDENKLEVIDLLHKDGVRIYQRSLFFVFSRAVSELFDGAETIVEHSLSKGLYCQIKKDKKLSKEDVTLIEEKMKEIVALNEKFKQNIVPKETAKKAYLKLGLEDKAKLLDYRKEKTVKIYEFGGMKDYYYGYMVDRAGKLDKFKLKYYGEGLILRHPNEYSNGRVPNFVENKKLYKTHREAEKWGEILGVSYLRNIDDLIKSGEIASKILTAEALHEKKIIEIADAICKKNKRIILIAGPSSSGKTTFANRLKIQLAVNGLRPVTISVDDYFVNREKTPKDENGALDFEHIDAIDRHRFNQDIKSLLSGKKTKLPRFDFTVGKRMKETHEMQVSSDQPIIIEGIHCLNPIFSEEIPDEHKFRIYISCLTQLNIDEHNRIPTTDSRLIRRLVRDHYHRGNDGARTLNLWSLVRRGEERNIFPYQETADAQFNSASMYELSALKKHVEPILKEVPENTEESAEANRLLKLLSYVLPLEDESVIPNTAIIREFIGGNIFREV